MGHQHIGMYGAAVSGSGIAQFVEVARTVDGREEAGAAIVAALHEVLREELAGSGVRATLVSPAATDTPIWDPIDPDHTPGFPPRASMLRPDDVADAVLWAVTRPAHVNVDELRLSRS